MMPVPSRIGSWAFVKLFSTIYDCGRIKDDERERRSNPRHSSELLAAPLGWVGLKGDERKP